MKKGFTMFLNGKDYFFITTCKSTKSPVLIKKVCAFFNAPENENTRAFLVDKLQAATLEYQKASTIIKTKNGAIVTPYGDNATVIVGLTTKNRNIATKEHVDKLKKALETAKKEYQKAPENYHVSISTGNDKTGDVANVSTLPFIFCPAAAKETCGKKCYAFVNAMNGSRPEALAAWAMNTAILFYNPKKYFDEISSSMRGYRFFRYHVSGEIIDHMYFQEMVRTAYENKNTDIMVFTKRYDIINRYIENMMKKHGCTAAAALPENLHVIFSAWKDEITIDNPYNFPVSDVLEENETCPVDGFLCGGNCFFCACRGIGCWQLQPGQKIYFYEH